MLNIEVIKFEAQDVITASVAAPEELEKYPCPCETSGSCEVDEYGTHWVVIDGTKAPCGQPTGHTCGK